MRRRHRPAASRPTATTNGGPSSRPAPGDEPAGAVSPAQTAVSHPPALPGPAAVRVGTRGASPVRNATATARRTQDPPTAITGWRLPWRHHEHPAGDGGRTLVRAGRSSVPGRGRGVLAAAPAARIARSRPAAGSVQGARRADVEDARRNARHQGRAAPARILPAPRTAVRRRSGWQGGQFPPSREDVACSQSPGGCRGRAGRRFGQVRGHGTLPPCPPRAAHAAHAAHGGDCTLCPPPLLRRQGFSSQLRAGGSGFQRRTPPVSPGFAAPGEMPAWAGCWPAGRPGAARQGGRPRSTQPGLARHLAAAGRQELCAHAVSLAATGGGGRRDTS